MFKLALSFFILGLSFGLGPCVASCGPLLISYTAATNKNILQSLKAYLLFSLSRVLVYIGLSLAIFLFGQLAGYILGAYARYLFALGGLFIVIIGLLVIFGKGVDFKFFRKLRDFLLKKDSKTIIILGLIIGILPCAPFISIVSYIGLVTKHWWDSLFYGLAFGLGTVFSPLFILVVLCGFIPRIISQQRFCRIFNALWFIIIFLVVQLIRRVF